MRNSNSQRSTTNFCIIGSVAALGGLLFGYDTSVSSGALIFSRHVISLSPTMLGIVVAVTLAGAAMIGHLSDQAGRRRVIPGAGLLFTRRGRLGGYSGCRRFCDRPLSGRLFACHRNRGMALDAVAWAGSRYCAVTRQAGPSGKSSLARRTRPDRRFRELMTIVSIWAECLADGRRGSLKRVVQNHGPRPEAAHQFVLGNQHAGLRRQQFKDLERAPTNRYRRPGGRSQTPHAASECR